jgi:large subunit ribosomal protein L10
LAISKERKNEVVAQYGEWLAKSRAMVLAEYRGLSMKELDDLRNKAREAGGEFHIIKNTLGKLAFQGAGMPLPEHFLEGSTAIGFAFQDAPALAKTMTDFARSTEFFKVKGGYLGNRPIGPGEVTALAEMPPLPVMRARLLGTIMAPASQVARILAEPARQVAAVIKAYAEKDAVGSAA